MFTESNKIIVVDNSHEDLNKIAYEFNQKGIGCRTIYYDGFSFPEKPFTDVRVAFFDVNLGQAFSDKETYAILENAIESYISEENGPYVLIFWTNNSEWKDGFIDYVNRATEDSNVVRDKIKPYHVAIIDKTTISENNTLESMLKKEFENQLVELCLNFDEQLNVATDKTFYNLLSLVEIGEKWGHPDKFEEGLKKLFAKVAVESWGYGNAKVNPDGAIKDAILPVIAQSLPQKQLWNTFLNDYLNQLDPNNIYPKDDLVIPKLNNFFLIDDKITDIKYRGAVVKLSSEDLFKKYFGVDFLSWKKREFGESPNIVDAYPIAVEISAACDFSQQKSRNYKYLMGIACTKSIPDRKRDNIILINTILYKQSALYLAFDFNYIFVNYEPSIIESVLFGFKKELMDMIGNKYANHISRIGITSFK